MDMKSTCPCPNLIGSLMGDPDTRYSSTEAAKTPFFSLWFPDEWGRGGKCVFRIKPDTTTTSERWLAAISQNGLRSRDIPV
jgi:hypothetical protein